MARDRLIAQRKRQGLSQEKLAQALGVNPGTVRRWESGQSTPRVWQRESLADKLKVSLAELDLWLSDADAIGGLVPVWLTLYVQIEQQARCLRLYESTVLPGLLQTPDYAAALLRIDTDRTEERVQQLVELRTRRQAALTQDDPLELIAIIAETALRLEVGNRETMHQQLEHLAEMSELPNVTVQVLPFSAGPHHALRGAFTLLAMPWAATVAYVESYVAGATHIETPSEVERYGGIFSNLSALTLPPEESQEMIRQQAKEYTT